MQLDDFESGATTTAATGGLDEHDFTSKFPSLDGSDPAPIGSAAPRSNFPSIEDDDDDFGGFGASSTTAAAPVSQRADADFVGGFEREPAPVPAQPEPVHDEVSAFTSQFPDISASQTAQTVRTIARLP